MSMDFENSSIDLDSQFPVTTVTMVEQWLEKVLGSCLPINEKTSSNITTSALKFFDIDRDTLTRSHIDRKAQDRAFKSLYVYGKGFHTSLKEAHFDKMTMERLWNAFLKILEHCEPLHTETITGEQLRRHKLDIDQVVANHKISLASLQETCELYKQSTTEAQIRISDLSCRLQRSEFIQRTLDNKDAAAVEEVKSSFLLEHRLRCDAEITASAANESVTMLYARLNQVINERTALQVALDEMTVGYRTLSDSFHEHAASIASLESTLAITTDQREEYWGRLQVEVDQVKKLRAELSSTTNQLHSVVQERDRLAENNTNLHRSLDYMTSTLSRAMFTLNDSVGIMDALHATHVEACQAVHMEAAGNWRTCKLATSAKFNVSPDMAVLKLCSEYLSTMTQGFIERKGQLSIGDELVSVIRNHYERSVNKVEDLQITLSQAQAAGRYISDCWMNYSAGYKCKTDALLQQMAAVNLALAQTMADKSALELQLKDFRRTQLDLDNMTHKYKTTMKLLQKTAVERDDFKSKQLDRDELYLHNGQLQSELTQLKFAHTEVTNTLRVRDAEIRDHVLMRGKSVDAISDLNLDLMNYRTMLRQVDNDLETVRASLKGACAHMLVISTQDVETHIQHRRQQQQRADQGAGLGSGPMSAGSVSVSTVAAVVSTQTTESPSGLPSHGTSHQSGSSSAGSSSYVDKQIVQAIETSVNHLKELSDVVSESGAMAATKSAENVILQTEIDNLKEFIEKDRRRREQQTEASISLLTMAEVASSSLSTSSFVDSYGKAIELQQKVNELKSELTKERQRIRDVELKLGGKIFELENEIQSLKGNQWKPDKACQTDPVICESCVDFKEQIQGLMEEFTVVREKIRQSEIAIASKNKEIRQLSKQLQQQQPQQLRPSFQKIVVASPSPTDLVDGSRMSLPTIPGSQTPEGSSSLTDEAVVTAEPVVASAPLSNWKARKASFLADRSVKMAPSSSTSSFQKGSTNDIEMETAVDADPDANSGSAADEPAGATVGTTVGASAGAFSREGSKKHSPTGPSPELIPHNDAGAEASVAVGAVGVGAVGVGGGAAAGDRVDTSRTTSPTAASGRPPKSADRKNRPGKGKAGSTSTETVRPAPPAAAVPHTQAKSSLTQRSKVPSHTASSSTANVAAAVRSQQGSASAGD